MHRAVVAFAAAAFAAVMALVTSAPHAGAYEFGTRDEAIAMVQRVQEVFKKNGVEATLRAINNKKGFIDRDLYPFVSDFKGVDVANPVSPQLVGKDLSAIRDQDGKVVFREMLAIAQGPGHGWSNMRWINPVTKTIEDKSIYIERLGDDHFVGVGIYREEQPNQNTIGIISGSPNSDDTYLLTAYDLAEVLNDGDDLRILPVAGVGGPRNIRDVRILKGIDIGLTQSSILNNFRTTNERLGHFDDKIVYLAPLFTEEVHLVARSDVTSLAQLQGQKVNLDAKASGTSYTLRDVFDRLGIKVEEVSMSQVDAFEKLKSGEIAATAVVAGKPVRSMTKLKLAEGFHFLPIPYSSTLLHSSTLATTTYLPTRLTHDDYPDLILRDQPVDTIAVEAVLIAYNWPKNTDRYRRVAKFVDAFFSRISEFQKPPHHPKWQEVNIAATLPGWTRFDAAQAWLDSHLPGAATSQSSNVSQSSPPPLRGTSSAGLPIALRGKDAALYQEFLKWRRENAPSAASR
jgi:uncharacterized protein